MATSIIELDIEGITGVSDANDNFIISAQKFVVSSVPKSLLKWAGTETVAATHGGNDTPTANNPITLPVGTDKILSVRRGAYEATETPSSERAFLEADNGSLKEPTVFYPKYFISAGNQVKVKPNPTDSDTAHVNFVDYAKIDDASDLRNAVIYRACSSEFGKLSSAQNDDFETAIGLVFAAIAQASIAANKFASNTTDSVYDTNATWDATNSQLTRVKDAMDKVVLLIDGNKPTSGYDAHDLLQAEDIELLNGNLSIVKSELERAQVHISEWVSVGDMRVKEVNVALSEAQGSLGEINGRLAQRQAYAAESVKYYNWANQELQTYIGTNEKTIQYQSQQQTQAQ